MKTASMEEALQSALSVVDRLTELSKDVNEPLMTCRINFTDNRNAIIIRVYVPTLTSSDKSKERFDKD